MASDPETTPINASADWAASISGSNAGDDNRLWQKMLAWWAEFSLQTKLLAVATLVVSLMMTGITFFALNGIQRDTAMNDTRYARDLGLLLAGNVTELVAEDAIASWPTSLKRSGAPAAAFATSFSPTPTELSTWAFPSAAVTTPAAPTCA